MGDRPVICFLPVYIGSLKYYEKLLPEVTKTHDAHFLIIRENDERRRQMIAYLDTRGYAYTVLEEPKVRGGIPIVSALLKKSAQAHAARKALLSINPRAIVSMKTSSAFESIFKEANYLSIKTVIIQVALVAPKGLYGPSETDVPPAEELYLTIVKLAYSLYVFFSRGARYVRTSKEPLKIGVIDERALDAFSERFNYKPSMMTVVGNADFSVMHDLIKKAKDETYVAALKRKYTVPEGKKVILVLSSWARNYIHAKTTHTKEENEEQVNYFGKLIGRIRRVFSHGEAEIIFKMHPSEPNIYAEYEKQGVRILGDDALPEELVTIADLYIADPATSANYMVIASGKPAIFVNATELPTLNKAAKFYGIEHSAESIDEFSRMLEQFKSRTLPPTYRFHDEPDSLLRIVALITG